jgi:hypothetical protein
MKQAIDNKTIDMWEEKKTYSIAIKYVAYSNYTIDADSPEEAEAQAWADVNSDPDHAISYGNWELESIEEVAK